MKKKKIAAPDSESIQGHKGLKRMNSPDVPGGNRSEQLAELHVGGGKKKKKVKK